MRGVSLACSLALVTATAYAFQPPAAPQGMLPVGADGKPLNFDFETGTLQDWIAEGEAFHEQPIQGDTVNKRRGDMKSEHRGQFWIGSYERGLDRPQGTLTSAAFQVTQPFASFLVAGGSTDRTCVELVLKSSGKVIHRASGAETENLEPVVVDLTAHQGQEIFIRLVDRHSGGWGHLNFDDFKLYAAKPAFPKKRATTFADLYVHDGQSPQDAAKAMTVPEGFSVQLFAGEPDVVQPIAMAFDDRGRLWIAEAYSYPIRLPEEKARDRILIFEDADGDGTFDKRSVFADRLNLVSGLEVGFGGVWVGAAPHLLFIPDKDQDDKPDGPPQVLLDGWGYQDTHETLNAFIWGPDGWLYGCHGVFTYSRVGKPGTPDEARIPLNAGIWRYHPTRHVFELFAEGTSNPWGVDFNDAGQAFCTACVIPHLYHIIQGARYQRQAGNHFNPFTYDDIKTIARHRHWVGNQWNNNDRASSDSVGGGHAHAGAMIYLGGSWPEKYKNQIFMNNIHGQRINLDLLSPKNSGYEGNFAPDFLFAHDQWSQIINLRYGPDGQVYMIDWYDKNACHRREPEAHDRSNGRIFKVSYKNAKPVTVDLRKQTDNELVQLQLHANDWYVRHARRILQERGPNPTVHAALDKIAFEHGDVTRRLRGLWALHVTMGLNEPRLERAIADADPLMRAWSIQLLMETNGDRPGANWLARLANLAEKDDSPVVRIYLASAAGRLPLADRWTVVERLARHSEDASDQNLPLLYWYAIEPLVEQDTNRALAMAGPIDQLSGYIVQRIAAIGDVASAEVLIKALAKQDTAEGQSKLLSAIANAWKGRRQVPMPAAWPEVASKLLASSNASVRSQATALAVKFGDSAAFAAMRKTLSDASATTARRQEALAALLGAKDPNLAPTLQALVDDATLSGAALKGLAAYDDAKTPELILSRYAKFDADRKRDALATLSSRPSYAQALLAAVADKKIASIDLSADLIRQLRNLKDAEVDKRINEVWGSVRDTPADKARQIADLKAMLQSEPKQAIDVAHGRAMFAKTCQKCHVLFGSGGKVGPELTGSNRANLDYLLSNVVDPSAVMAREYMPSIVVTTDGRIVTGIIRQQDKDAVTVLTANETIVIPRAEIDEMQPTKVSMMPDDQLKVFSEHDIRSLVAYLASPAQTPLLATTENLAGFFSGKDLSGWQGKAELWQVENGEIVGRTEGLRRNEWLASEYILGDFRFSCQVKLTDNKGNSGIQFRSEPIANGEVKGYQADIGVGWWGKLYEEHGRALLWNKSGEAHVKPGEWNRYEIEVVGSKIRTWINGQPCVELDDPDGAKRGVIAFQLHSGGATEVRFKDLKLEIVDPSPKAAGG